VSGSPRFRAPALRAGLLGLSLALATGCGMARTVRVKYGHPDPVPEPVPIAALAPQVDARIAQSGATVGFYFKDLARSESLTVGADIRFHAASTMKVPVMIQVFRDVEAGRLRLDERIVVANQFRSLADSSSYALDRADDSDSSLYQQVGQSVSVRNLLELMITVSSNLATNNLIERVGAARVNATLRGLGIDSVNVLRGVGDGAAFRAGMNNTLTARGLAQVMAAIVDGRAAGAASCAEMLQVLLRQRFKEGIPAGLPPETPVAHKTGELTGHHHDAAIVYVGGRPRYVLVILTRGINERNDSSKLIADLAKLVHERLVPPPPPPPPRPGAAARP